jgi:hypothetical protein
MRAARRMATEMADEHDVPGPELVEGRLDRGDIGGASRRAR